MPKKTEETARSPDGKPVLRDEKGRFIKLPPEMKKPRKKKPPRDPAEIEAARKRKEQARSPVNGQPVPQGRPFVSGDSRAKEAQLKGAQAKREKNDLRQLCRIWMEEEVGTGKDGEKITGGQMMVQVAVKEVAKGNPRFWELLRDTAGYKPVDKVMVADVDPGVIAEVEQLVREAADEKDGDD